MADTVALDVTAIPSSGDYVAKGRRSLINPGDRKHPTNYYSHSLTQNHSMGTKTSQRVYAYKPTVTVTPNFIAGSKGEGLISKTQFLNWPGYSYPPTSSPLFQEADRVAVSRLLSKVQDAKGSGFNAALFAAESGKSLSMITSAATRSFLAMKALKRGRLGDVYRALGQPTPKGRLPGPNHVRQNAANYWLEVSYGWTPLVSDAKSAAEKIAQLVVEQVPVCSVKSRGRQTSRSWERRTSSLPHHIISQTERCDVEYQLDYRYSDPVISQASSLGLTNPALIVWEVIPLSFVMDWFLPIGQFLDELSAYHGLTFVDGRTTRLRDGRYVLETYSYRQSYGSTFGIEEFDDFSGSSYKKIQFGWTRDRLTSPPRARFPSPRAPFSGTTALQRAATAVSLLVQRNPFAQTRV